MSRFLLIISILILAITAGCESGPPVGPAMNSERMPYGQTADTRGYSIMEFTIIQEYGYCDSTGCYGLSFILHQGSLTSEEEYRANFGTMGEYVIENGRILPYVNTQILWSIQGTSVFITDIDDMSYWCEETGSVILDISLSTKHTIFINQLIRK